MRKLSLETRFALLLSALFVAGSVVCGFALWEILERRAQDEVANQALILIETMNSVRSYTTNEVAPLLHDKQATSQTFIKETVPAFSAKQVFDNFRKADPYNSFRYKEASLNPTNPSNRADGFEAALIEQMRADPKVTEITNFRSVAGRSEFYIARPLRVTSPSCLPCHTTPEVAPPSLVATYGREGGFGWQLNDVIAAQITYVPAQEIQDRTLRSFSVVMILFVALFALATIMSNFLLRRYVIQPVTVLSNLAEKIRTDEMVAEDLESAGLARVTARPDELGNLAEVFRRMAREIYARTQSLKQQVQDLRIEIDEIRRQKQVSEVVETDFFQDLQAKARRMRTQRHSGGGEPATETAAAPREQGERGTPAEESAPAGAGGPGEEGTHEEPGAGEA